MVRIMQQPHTLPYRDPCYPAPPEPAIFVSGRHGFASHGLADLDQREQRWPQYAMTMVRGGSSSAPASSRRK